MKSIFRLVWLAISVITIAGCASAQRRTALPAAVDLYNVKVTTLNNEIDALSAEAQALQRDPAFRLLKQRFAEAALRRIIAPLTGRAATNDFLATMASMSPEERVVADRFAILAQRAAALDRQWKALDRERARLEKTEVARVARKERWARVRAAVGFEKRTDTSGELSPPLLMPSPPLLCRMQYLGQFPTLTCG